MPLIQVIVLGLVFFVLFGPRAGSGNQPAPDDTPPEPETSPGLGVTATRSIDELAL